MALLEVKDLRTYFAPTTASSRPSTASASRSRRARRSGIVGESGCGKSVTCLTIMGLNPQDAARSRAARRCSRARTCSSMKPTRLREIRGNEIAMIFQDPMTSLNPVHTIGTQLVEAVLLHQRRLEARGARRGARAAQGGRHPARRAAHRRLPAPVLGRHAPARDDRDGADQRPRPADRRRADDGARRDDPGADPGADEELQEDFGSAIIMITHDLGVVAEIADDVVVMYAGRVVEHGDGRRALRAAAPPVHVGPARLAAAPRRRRRAARADPRPAAVAAQPAERLPLPPALPVRDGRLPARTSPSLMPAQRGAGHLQALPSSTRRRRTREAAEARWRARWRRPRPGGRRLKATSCSSSRT